MSSKPTIVILGDGYQTEAAFMAHATRVRDSLLSDTAFAGKVEVVPVFRAAPMNGLPTSPNTDQSAYGSYLLLNGAGRWGGGIANVPRVRADTASVNGDWALMLFNTGVYYGTNLVSYGVAVVAGGNTHTPGLAKHELAHLMSDLADEYRSSSSFDPPLEEPQASNLTIDPKGTKWKHLIGTQAANGQIVGVYEGAGLYPRGVYRPCPNTMMRDQRQPFSPVDILAIHRGIAQRMNVMPGDIDKDGDVDFADMNIVLANYGRVGPNVEGDNNLDGIVDLADLNSVMGNYGKSADNSKD